MIIRRLKPFVSKKKQKTKKRNKTKKRDSFPLTEASWSMESSLTPAWLAAWLAGWLRVTSTNQKKHKNKIEIVPPYQKQGGALNSLPLLP